MSGKTEKSLLPRDGVFAGLSQAARDRLTQEIKKAVSRQVRKELARRRKKAARRLIFTGLVFAGGCVLYFASDPIIDLLMNRWINAKPKKRPSGTGKMRLTGRK